MDPLENVMPPKNIGFKSSALRILADSPSPGVDIKKLEMILIENGLNKKLVKDFIRDIRSNKMSEI